MSKTFQIESPKQLYLRLTMTYHLQDQAYQLFDQQGAFYVTLDGTNYLQVRPDPQIPDFYLLEDGQSIKAKLNPITTPYLEFQIDNTQLSTIYKAIYTDADVTPDAKQKFSSMEKFYVHLSDTLTALWKNGDQKCGLTIDQQKDNIIIDYFEEYRPTNRKLILVEIQINLKETPLTMEDKMTIFKDKLSQICNQYEQFNDIRGQYDQYQNQINQLASKLTELNKTLEQQAQEVLKLQSANDKKDVMIDQLKAQVSELQTLNVQTMFKHFTLIQNEFNRTTQESTHALLESKLLEIPKASQQSQSIDGSLQIGTLTQLQLQLCNIPAANGYFYISQPFGQTTATKFIIKTLEEGHQISFGVCDADVLQQNYLLQDPETYRFQIPDGLVQKSDLPTIQLINHLFQVKDQITLKVTLGEKDGNVITLIVNNGQRHNVQFSGHNFRFFIVTTSPNAVIFDPQHIQ